MNRESKIRNIFQPNIVFTNVKFIRPTLSAAALNYQRRVPGGFDRKGRQPWRSRFVRRIFNRNLHGARALIWGHSKYNLDVRCVLMFVNQITIATRKE